ncbi:hypothetical protein T265_03479 [Opisthorchis viverrini]|uniref:Uncharacterized protein n=1 Tax=Opisthorchis viverrini TaxID=6198 RepID=A0A074ZVT3_OPIVI|nr:hypothetical protein T265_03479 [Opisthorchis viverrini]KER29997.1 hypothetical protein T265_03479 [Opisthorchis viverrini]
MLEDRNYPPNSALRMPPRTVTKRLKINYQPQQTDQQPLDQFPINAPKLPISQLIINIIISVTSEIEENDLSKILGFVEITAQLELLACEQGTLTQQARLRPGREVWTAHEELSKGLYTNGGIE